MVLANQLIYLVNIKTIRKIFSNYVCFNLKATQSADRNSNHDFLSLKDLIAIKDRLNSAFLFILGNQRCCLLPWIAA